MVGGGSAGHVVPALPVVALLQAAGHEVVFVGTRSGLEQDLTRQAGVTYHGIAAGKLRRYWSWQNFIDVLRIGLGIIQSVFLLLRKRPAVVFSKGGFVSFPVVFAAWLLRIPVVAHESDLSPGLANRLVLPFVKTLCTSFAQTRVSRKPGSGLQVLHTGTPIRPDLLAGDPERGRERLQIQGNKPLLVITGGSLGAQHLNAVVRAAVPRLVEHYVVLHVCGPGKRVELNTPQDDYQQVEYVSDGWGDILAAADIVVSRAGANALFELLALRKINLLVPLSRQASRGDQIENAAFAAQHNYSLVVQEEDLHEDSLLAALDQVLARRVDYQKALDGFVVPDAAELLAAEISRHL